ncbi:hypothetical protein KR044_002660, partial [Drosophila immigrans]
IFDQLQVIFACLLAVAFAEDADVRVLETDVGPESFKTVVELSDGSVSRQEGSLHGDEWIVEGKNEHISPEGVKVSIDYVADANGYQVRNAEPPLPTPHPIPEAIQRAIEYISQHAIAE